MPDVIPLLSIHRFIGPDGGPVEVEVRADVAELLAATEPRLKERTCTDVGIDPDQVVDGVRRDGTYVGFAWEGPRFQFDRLIGESRIWNGPPGRLPDGRCEFCLDSEIETSTLCLGCERSGRDKQIPRPTGYDLERRRERKRRAHVRGRLKGGVG